MHKTNHSFHMVTISPWPLILSINLMLMLISIIKMFYLFKIYLLFISFLNMNLILF